MKTSLRILLLAGLAVLAGCAAPVDRKSCDAPQIQRELSYTPPGCEQAR
jgi:hypothetical protein